MIGIFHLLGTSRCSAGLNGLDLAMFANRLVRPTLVETYEEAEKVEAEWESIEHYPMQSEDKTFGNKKPLLLTKPKDE